MSVIILLFAPNATMAATRPEMLALITKAEQQYHVPSGLLLAIIRIESNLQPFALNLGGRVVFAKDKEQALEIIHKVISKGITNIDIGPAQLNYKWHHQEFSNIEDMLNPQLNITYAAKLLAQLKTQKGSWHEAIRYYHSSKPRHYAQYSRKVVLCWLNSDKKLKI